MSNLATMVERRSSEDLITPNNVRDMRLLLALMQDHVPKVEGSFRINKIALLENVRFKWFVNGRYIEVLGEFPTDKPLDVSPEQAEHILAKNLFEYFITVQPEMNDDSTPLAYDIGFRLTAPTPLRSAKLMAQITVINEDAGVKVRQYNLSEDLDDFYDQNNY